MIANAASSLVAAMGEGDRPGTMHGGGWGLLLRKTEVPSTGGGCACANVASEGMSLCL